MNPALSVIFFTTLSGAGYGVLMWLGVCILAGHAEHGASLLLSLASLCVASVLVAIGLLSSMAHLGKPGRAWRAFSQWRTSWLSREGVMAIVTYLPVAALLAVIGLAVKRGDSTLHAPLPGALASVLVVCALATVVCTAMIYGSLKTIPAWRHPLVVPAYVAFALLTGGALLAVMDGLAGAAESSLRSFAVTLAAIALATTALKVAYWRAIDQQHLPGTRGDAVGLPGRTVKVFERPHTEESYITREMAFAVARKHARRLRVVALLLFGAAPVLMSAAVWLVPTAAVASFSIAAIAALAGAFVERWLFFAEARHIVTLYY